MNKRRSRTSSLAAWRRAAISRMERSRRRTLALLSAMPEPEVLRPRTQGLWSIKDVLAHFAAWEEEGVRRLALVVRGRGDRIHFYEDMREADRFNARAIRAARPLSLAALRRRAARVRRQLIGALRRLPPEALRDPAHEVPVVGWLPEFAWTHEQGHRVAIRAWWARARRRRGP